MAGGNFKSFLVSCTKNYKFLLNECKSGRAWPPNWMLPARCSPGLFYECRRCRPVLIWWHCFAEMKSGIEEHCGGGGPLLFAIHQDLLLALFSSCWVSEFLPWPVCNAITLALKKIDENFFFVTMAWGVLEKRNTWFDHGPPSINYSQFGGPDIVCMLCTSAGEYNIEKAWNKTRAPRNQNRIYRPNRWVRRPPPP